MKRKECEKENVDDGSTAGVDSSSLPPAGKRRCHRSDDGSGVLSEILSLYGKMAETAKDGVLNDDVLCLRRRLRRPLEPAVEENARGINVLLSEELLLRVFSWLDKGTLGRVARVCRKWERLSGDDSLWKRLDLGSKTIGIHTLLRLASRGILALRVAKAFLLPEPSSTLTLEEISTPLKLTYLDLSMCEVSLGSLKALLRRTGNLRKVSLETCPLDNEACEMIATNGDLRVLHLSMAKGLEDRELLTLLDALHQVEELNIGWTDVGEEGMGILAEKAPTTLRRLNVAGMKEALSDKTLTALLARLPNLTELDVSDAGNLTEESIDAILLYSKKIEHLRVSRCYGISPNAYITLGVMNTLKYLTVFGVMKDAAIQELRLLLPGIIINKHMFSTVARPTVGIRKTSIWNIRVRD